MNFALVIVQGDGGFDMRGMALKERRGPTRVVRNAKGGEVGVRCGT